MSTHQIYIKRCLDIAKNGLGTTRPNPAVGCVIVYKNQIIGEGFTGKYGGNHAEVNAINSVTNKQILKEATIYVTLEPCSHFGKTPPCSDLIIKHNIPRVVIGCIDDNEKVAGKGIKKLKDAGCEVIVGVLEEACKSHHKRFFTFHNKKRPYIILKWAETADGYIAPFSKDEQKPVWITNKYSRQWVHKWRTEEQAILIGTNTVIEDNPSLTARDWEGNQPMRIVIDKENRLQKHYNVFNKESKTISITKDQVNFSEDILEQTCNLLYTENINSLIVEGGTQTLQSFINKNLWDEARIFTGKPLFKSGTKAPKFSGYLISEEFILEDNLKIYIND
ncbi:bifunctional diaminohydroxyphosphoribosylaminopyrimidine deaminase/5-amino-6-(5-phosphoribosylamino)uracil reductase RibD [uncultured Algibacter sp.]|uniref:bifunctional diaminohydroxyphosphoribosylaminopyrimidine deaminase/5-amino-6-(5-phosphoribosylamino)uracil reductase RibD n=1 Tax=uncultured Algibacter sp. TaxID=298659 RepID=UPI00262F1AB7|nr:bifunctional diaminohydroxyphosphoribosylaminopyrimidine deaminase/5-amino-6-(5-phosphoribosylamino)uracil reductase RibD [uncultured Algibacter sp.]